MMKVQRAAVIGGGVIGAGWAARLSLNGIAVSIYDSDPEAPRKVSEVLQTAAVAYSKLTAFPLPPAGEVSFARSVSEAVAGADWITESVPERLEIKHKVYEEIEVAADSQSVVTSSTSGFRPGVLQEGMKHPDRFLVAHPFNPPYLIPLVELCGGDKTSTQTMEQAIRFYESLGMRPLKIRKEIDAFVADRLLEAAWREALWLVKDGIATTEEIDDAIRFGFGLRWAQMGIFETYRIAGGEGGILHFLEQFGPSLRAPWTKLTEVPELSGKLAQTIAEQSDSQSGAHSIRELESIRDNNLIAILQGLKANRQGAGQTLNSWEDQLRKNITASQNITGPLRTLERRAPLHWTDYNGHVNESRYLECSSDASDAVLQIIGANAEYVAAGNSYFTVETHIRNLQEARAGDMIYGDTTILLAEGKKLKLFHQFKNSEGEIFATGEHILIHVDLNTRRSSLPDSQILKTAQEIAAAHAALPIPEGAGKI